MIGTILLSIIIGVILTLLVQYLLFSYWLSSFPVTKDNWKSQSDPFVLPQELLKIFEDLKDQNERESYKSLNFVFQFLFQELKDAEHVRKWAMKRLKSEFSELLQSTTGKLLDEIRIRGFNLGRTFPIIKNVSLSNVSINEDNVLDEVTLLLDLTYNGRFQLAVDVDMVFGKSAYLSVTVTKLQGAARLQFSTVPYRHWSFAFTEDPLLEFEVDSHFEGRPIARLASVITNQIKRQVRKKHTLPNYKIRYKPFFVMPTSRVEPQDVFYQNLKLSVGKLDVVVVGCTRLIQASQDSHIYCSLAIDSMPWTELMSFKRKLWVPCECELVKTSPQLGLAFEDEFLLDKCEEAVIVTSVIPGSPACKANIRKSDVVVSINGTKVASSKQASRIIKLSGEKMIFRIERDISVNADVNQTTTKKQIIKVPSMDSLSSFSKDLEVKEGPISKGSEETLLSSKFNNPDKFSLVNSNLPLEGSKLKHVSSAVVINSDAVSIDSRDRDNGLKDFSINSAVKSDKESSSENFLSNQPNNDDSTSNDAFLHKTRLFKSCQNPVFNQRFWFKVKPHQNYLNICVWCRETEKLDKQMKVIKMEKDILLGHVSISLMDIALECAATLQGDFTNSFNLVPSQSKVGMGRQQYSNVSTHPGFEERLCHGDILLRFQYSREEDDSYDHNLEIFDIFHKESSPGTSIPIGNEKISTNLHCFQPAQFQSAVHCKFCSKKIWFKSAFMCTTCKMVCHKKCIDKCQVQTTCSKPSPKLAESGTGERKRHKSAPDEPNKEVAAGNVQSPLESSSLTRKSSSSSLKDVSANDSTAENGETKKLRSPEYWSNLTTEDCADERIIITAKLIGRQLYADLELCQRKERFDEVIYSTQLEVEYEIKHQNDLRVEESKATDKKLKVTLRNKFTKSEEKIKSLRVLMLQYCAGLQYCLDEEENMKQQKALQREDEGFRLTENSNISVPDPHSSSQAFLEGSDIFSEASNLPLINENVNDHKCDSISLFGKELASDDCSNDCSVSETLSAEINTNLQVVTDLMKDEDDIKSELLEEQPLSTFHQFIDTSSQKSLELDTSPEDDGVPVVFERTVCSGDQMSAEHGDIVDVVTSDKEINKVADRSTSQTELLELSGMIKSEQDLIKKADSPNMKLPR